MVISPADFLPPKTGNLHEDFMREAILEAIQAYQEDEVPVGAILVKNGEILSRAHNFKEQRKDPLAHAEILVIQDAVRKTGDWRLEDTTLYVTLEPCPMCAGAMIQARVPQLFFGAEDPKAGACTSLYQILSDSRLNHRTQIGERIYFQQSGDLLRSFFRAKRKNKPNI